MTVSGKNQVVIVGGSSGANVAALLSKARTQFDPAKNDLILISQLPYHVHLVASARLITTSDGNLDSTSQAFMPFDQMFAPGNAGTFVQGKVVHVFDDHVELEDGRSVPFEFLLLGLGSRWPDVMNFDFTTDKEVRNHVDTWRSNISKAASIVIVGGGSVGVELSAEIKHFFPRKSVTVVQGATNLLNSTYPDKFRTAVAQRVKSMGVNVILGEKVLDIPPINVAFGPVSAKTVNGLEIVADLFIPCFGPVPNTSSVATLHSGAALTPNGHVRVTPTLNVQLDDGTVLDNIWAIGDIIAWKEQHQLTKVQAQTPIVAYNMLEAVKAKEIGGKPKVKEYKGFMELIGVSMGPTGGIIHFPLLWGIILGDWFVVFIKSANLFVKSTRSLYGLKA